MSYAAPLVCAVVVNWNGKDVLGECLESLEKTDYPAERLRVTVVDNASSDGSPAVVCEGFPRVTLLKNSSNLGYAAAVNRGVEQALGQGADYVWVFNNDVAVDPQALRHLLKAAESDPRIGVAGPVILAAGDGQRIEHAGYRINPWFGFLKKLKFGEDVFRDGPEGWQDVDSVLGCSNLIKAAAWRKVGPLNSAYGVYFEETDFNARCRRLGWRVVLVRDARVRHKGAATMNRFLGRRAWLLLRNLLIFQCRNARACHLFVFIPYYFLVHVPYFLIRGFFYGISVKLRGSK